MSATRAFVAGEPADAAALIRFARSGYTHFSTMQVRAGAVRGLTLHLTRLQDATRILFDAALDVEVLRRHLRRALEGRADASLRVSVGAANFSARQMPTPARIEVLVLVDPPAPQILAPVRLMSVTHTRHLPQIKSGGSFDLFHLRRQARAAGFDDALLLTPDGLVAEGTTFNVGFFSGDALLWPQAPQLEGTTMRLLSEAFEAAGKGVAATHATVLRRPVALAEVAGFDAGFCCNSGGIWPIQSIDAIALPEATARMARLQALWAGIAAEPI